jgi:glycosyltransferase involved in cell wall biosynthesis
VRIGLDARTVFARQRRGTGKNLIDLYRTLAAARPQWEFLMFYQTAGSADPFSDLPNVRAVAIDIPGDRFNMWQDVRLPAAAWANRVDVLHCPANTAPFWSPVKTVLTVHDLIPLEIAPDSPATARWVSRVRRSARQARAVITPSQYSRQAIMSHLGVPADRIHVNYWAPDRACAPAAAADVNAARRAHGVPDDVPYVLAYGAEDVRKNTAAIIKAWGQVDAAIRRAARLVIVGLQPDALQRMRDLAAQHVPDGSCLVHGFVPEGEMVPLLTGAAALCYVSLSEGFGLPIVDAFACGTPVITSSTTSLPEIAGDAAVLVDPTDVAAIARGMADVLTSEPLRRRLADAGRQRLTQFSWDRCAATAAAVLDMHDGEISR